LESTLSHDSGLPRPHIQGDDIFRITIHDDVGVVRDHQNLPFLFDLSQLRHDQVIDQVVVEIVFWLIKHERLISIRKDKGQERGRFLPRRSLLHGFEALPVLEAASDVQGVIGKPATDSIYLLGGQSLNVGDKSSIFGCRHGRCIVVISEGFDVGRLGEEKDNFGHTTFSSSRQTVAQIVTNYLNSLPLPVPGKARFQIPGTDQRNAMIYASTVDMEEAYLVGEKCVRIAREDGTGWMGTLLRQPGRQYRVRFDKAPLEQVANSERHFPQAWIAENRFDVTDDFINYARPLIGADWPAIPLENGLQRFARFAPVFAEKKLEPYVPQSYR